MQGEKCILVLPMFIGNSGQYVAGQSAVGELSMVVPMIPESMVPIEVSPGEVRSLPFTRLRQGTQIIIKDFSLTSAVVFTGEMANGLMVYFQEEVRKVAPTAAQFACDLATGEAEKVRKISNELEHVRTPLPGLNDFFRDTDQRITIAKAFLDKQDYRQAYLEATRALRPLRRLMRLQWEQAAGLVKGYPANASPYLVCYYTLPKHWAFMDSIGHAVPGTNALPGGGFEGQPDPNWTLQQKTLDDVQMQARFSDQKPHEGRQFLELNIVPKPNPPEPGKPPQPVKAPEALDRTFNAVSSPSVHLTPGTLVRISAWLRVPAPIKASADGAMFYDSIGGHDLGVRLTAPTDWKQFVLYRRVPASGDVSVTMALTGLGSAQFDDVRIEPMLPINNGPTVVKP